MSESLKAPLMSVLIVSLMAAIVLLGRAWADEEGSVDWSESPYHEWMARQQVNPEARGKLNIPWSSCCDHSDRVKTQFRVDKETRGDTWWFLDPASNVWRQIPNEIIHEEYDPTMPMQLRVEGVLFIYAGRPTCFWPPEGGG